MGSVSQGLRQEVVKQSSSLSTERAGVQFPGVSQTTDLTRELCFLCAAELTFATSAQYSCPTPIPHAEYCIPVILTSCARYWRAWREEAAGACGPSGHLSPSTTSLYPAPPAQALGTQCAACSKSRERHEAMSVAKGRMCAEPREVPIGWQ